MQNEDKNGAPKDFFMLIKLKVQTKNFEKLDKNAIHSLNAAHEQQTSLAQKKLVHMAI